MSMLENVKVTMLYRGSTGLAATNVDSTVRVDMKGYEGCLLLTSIIETTAGASTTALHLLPRHADTSTGTLTDLGTYAGDATITTADWGQAMIVDVYKPLKRYLSVSVDKPGNGTIATSGVFAIQYGGKKGPITQSSSYVEDSEILISPTT